MGVCCAKCFKSGSNNKNKNTYSVNRFGAYRDDVDDEDSQLIVDGNRQKGRNREKYRDKYYDDDDNDEEPYNAGDQNEDSNGEHNMLSERQIRDLVQKQLRALHELDEKLNDENREDDELEEEAFLDEVRRSSPQSRKPKVDDPAKVLLDLESATNKALNNLENENYDDEFSKFMSQMDSDNDDPEEDFESGDHWLR